MKYVLFSSILSPLFFLRFTHSLRNRKVAGRRKLAQLDATQFCTSLGYDHAVHVSHT
jgi:hypothetical protein